MDIVQIVSNIKDHKIQKLLTNSFEQGNPYVQHSSLMSVTNKFIEIPDTKCAPSSAASSDAAFQSAPSIFDKVAMMMENGVILDKLTYKNAFYNQITNDIYRSVSKRHVALKKDLFEFVFDDTYKLPANKDVVRLLQRVINMNVVICASDRWFGTYMNEGAEAGLTVVVREASSFATPYDSFSAAKEALVREGLREKRDFASMKVSELQAYAQEYHIDVSGLRKKQDIIEKLQI